MSEEPLYSKALGGYRRALEGYWIVLDDTIESTVERLKAKVEPL